MAAYAFSKLKGPGPNEDENVEVLLFFSGYITILESRLNEFNRKFSRFHTNVYLAPIFLTYSSPVKNVKCIVYIGFFET